MIYEPIFYQSEVTISQLAKRVMRGLETRADHKVYPTNTFPQFVDRYDIIGDLSFDVGYDALNDAATLFAYDADNNSDIDELIDGIEADIYTRDLMQWFASDPDHCELVNEAMRDYGCKDIEAAMQFAQAQQRQDVARRLYEALEQAAEDFNAIVEQQAEALESGDELLEIQVDRLSDFMETLNS